MFFFFMENQWFSGITSLSKLGSTPTEETIHVLSDTQLPSVAATDHDETLQLCSPSELLNTDVARQTLRDVDEHDAAMETEAFGG